jgi:signal transduction histidine kinase
MALASRSNKEASGGTDTTMNDESAPSGLYIELLQTLHNLTREAVALEQLIATRLGCATSEGDDDSSMVFLQGDTLYSLLQRRVKKQEFALNDATELLSLSLIGLDRFRYRVQNLLASLSRKQELKPATVALDVRSLLHAVTDLLEGQAQEKGIAILYSKNEAGFIYGDWDLMFRALFNVVDNAIKYSYPLSQKVKERFIDIDSRRHSIHGEWLIAIKSYGVGIEDDEIRSDAIFQYGARGRLAAASGRGGSGIGLAEARRIVLAHKGTIKIDSKPLEAAFVTIVRLILPGRAL